MISYEWRGRFGNAAVNALHAEAFGHEVTADDWWSQVSRHSLGWVCAWQEDELAGFVNVAWNGGGHAFLIDTAVAARARHRGIGTALVSLAAGHARQAGCGWLHVDFEDHLRPFYLGSCGFRPTSAGLVPLVEPGRDVGVRVIFAPRDPSGLPADLLDGPIPDAPRELPWRG